MDIQNIISSVEVFLSNDLVALAAVQIVGAIFLIVSRESNNDIKLLSGTYFDYNIHTIRLLVAQRFDQYLGLLTVIIPTLLNAMDSTPFWISYVCLSIALIARFSPVRGFYISLCSQKIKDLHKAEEEGS